MSVPVWGEKKVKSVSLKELEAHDYEYFFERLQEEGKLPSSFLVEYIPTRLLFWQVQGMMSDWGEEDEEFVNNLRTDMRRGFSIPPVILKKGKLVDGRHRVVAAAALKIKEVPSISIAR
jgi:hypothetical protein